MFYPVRDILHSRDTAIAGYEMFSGHIFNEKTWHYAQNWNSAWNKEKPRNVINSNIFHSIFRKFQPAEKKNCTTEDKTVLSCNTGTSLISSINSISRDCSLINYDIPQLRYTQRSQIATLFLHTAIAGYAISVSLLIQKMYECFSGNV